LKRYMQEQISDVADRESIDGFLPKVELEVVDPNQIMSASGVDVLIQTKKRVGEESSSKAQRGDQS
jgi:hypothetical protein